jgi:cobalt-zinc-cadmium efflux system outer membrane protein
MLHLPSPARAAAPFAALLVLPAALHAQAPDRYPLGADLPAFAAPAGRAAAGPPTPPEPSGGLQLREALALVLLHNPELAAESYELRAREAALLQAAALPNPTLDFEFEDFAGTGEFGGTDLAQTTLVLGQLIELGGKRAARTAVAAAERDLAAWDYELRRIDVLAETAAAFVEVLAAQERLELVEEAFALADAVRDAAVRRRRTGLASPADEMRAGVAADVTQVERERSEHELRVARRRLAALWSSVAPRFERAVGDLEALPRPPSEAELATRLDASLSLARWRAERSRRDALRAQARSERVPDVTLFAGPRRISGAHETALVAGFALPLPLWDRRRGAIEEAEYRAAQLEAERRATRASVATEVAAAHIALVASVEEAQLLRTRVLPGIERARDVLRRGYEDGRFPQHEVLDAERTHVETRGQYLRALVEAHHSAREIERLTGTPLEVAP